MVSTIGENHEPKRLSTAQRGRRIANHHLRDLPSRAMIMLNIQPYALKR